ncbi:hypothetical protein [Falsiroseomonas sp.]|uniref:hypothetical protein n=1 Tax=Falsiroseomonas sp. TaxID=2870721 RepID=UPI0035677A2E
MRRVVLFLFALLITTGAAAQESVIQCGPAIGPTEEVRPGQGFMTLSDIVGHLSAAAPGLKIERVRQTALAVPTVELAVLRPDTFRSPAEWRAAWFEAVVHPSGARLDANRLIRGRVHPPVAEDQLTPLVAEFPSLPGGWWPSRWDVYVFACIDPGYDPAVSIGNGRAVRAFARQPMYVSSLNLSAAVGLGCALALYLGLAVAAAQTQSRQYAFARASAAREGRGISRLAFFLQPPVIMQDAFGHCSLARFQVLLFTLVITGVYAYVMVRTGSLPNLSPTVLGLLGITLAGSALARVAEGPVVDTPNRLWLLGTGVLDPSPRLPRWHDLITGEGEIDVTRVQALAFSIFAAAALVVNGTGDLERFEIPDQINYLMGISQAVYVAGKALPRDAAKRLNEEIRALREAERAALADPGDAAALKAFETARNGVGSVLFDVFGERFDDSALRRLTPGRREPPPQPEL